MGALAEYFATISEPMNMLLKSMKLLKINTTWPICKCQLHGYYSGLYYKKESRESHLPVFGCDCFLLRGYSSVYCNITSNVNGTFSFIWPANKMCKYQADFCKWSFSLKASPYFCCNRLFWSWWKLIATNYLFEAAPAIFILPSFTVWFQSSSIPSPPHPPCHWTCYLHIHVVPELHTSDLEHHRM